MSKQLIGLLRISAAAARGHGPLRFSKRMRTSLHRREVTLQQLVSDFCTQDFPLDYRVVIVESGVDSRQLNLIHQGSCARKRLVRGGDIAVY